jgi:hypothetical protein
MIIRKHLKNRERIQENALEAYGTQHRSSYGDGEDAKEATIDHGGMFLTHLRR